MTPQRIYALQALHRNQTPLMRLMRLLQPTISSSVPTGLAAQLKPIMLSAPAHRSASMAGKEALAAK